MFKNVTIAGMDTSLPDSGESHSTFFEDIDLHRLTQI
jgi:hypothetical protein